MAPLLRLLMMLYVPMLLFIGLGSLALAIVLMPAAIAPGGILVMMLIGLLLFSGFHLLVALTPLFRKRTLVDRIIERVMEQPLPKDRCPKLHELVKRVAKEWNLPMPDTICVVPDDVAHVKEDEEGRRVLALGGIALGTLTQKSVAGIVAHELGHFAAGDTGLAVRGYRRLQVLDRLESTFAAQPLTKVNPLIWAVRGYHWFYMLIYFAHSRQQEYAADQWEVAHVGREAAAATTVLLYITNHLPWLRLSSIAETHATTKMPLEQIFEEQRRRAGSIAYHEWEDALARALKEPTRYFGSHPGLRDRLRAVGVKPKKALKIALSESGPPASDLVPDWPKLAKEMTESWISEMRKYHDATMEIAQIIIGRPIGRP